MPIPREIEAKYAVADPQVFADLAGLAMLGPYTLTPAPAPLDQINTYYDTADARLRAARHGFRIRMVGSRAVATLKGPPTSVGVAQARAEWELELPGADPARLPPGDLRAHLDALTGGAALLALLTIHTRRWTVLVEHGGPALIELALDESLIEAGGRTAPLRELELELLPAGAPADLEDLARRLCERYALTPEPRSKLERGLLLLGGS